MKTFKSLTKKFDYVNPSIESNFPLVKREEIGDYKLFDFDRYISSEDVEKEMEKEGYIPANLYELLTWSDWDKKDIVVALGSVGEVDGDYSVPCLDRYVSERRLDLFWWGGGWYADCRFLGVRKISSKNS